MSHAQAIVVGGLICIASCAGGTSQYGGGPLPSVPCAYDAIPHSRFELFMQDERTTREQALANYAARGYRLLAWSRYLLFERLAENTHPFEYLVLSSDGADAFQRNLNEAAGRGFRLVQRIFDHNNEDFSLAGYSAPITLGAVMEKRPIDASWPAEREPELWRRYEYRVVDDQSGSVPKFERRIGEVASTGYRVVAVGRFDSFDRDGTPEGPQELVAVLERTHDDATVSAVATDHYKIVAAKHSNVEKHHTEWRTRGYELAFIHANSMLVMGKSSQASQSEYLIVRPTGPAGPKSTLRRDMNEAASRGFRLRPRSLFWSATRGRLWTRDGVGLIMEKPLAAGSEPEYAIVDAYRESTLRQQLDSGLGEGFAPVDMMSVPGRTVIVLQRPKVPCHSRS